MIWIYKLTLHGANFVMSFRPSIGGADEFMAAIYFVVAVYIAYREHTCLQSKTVNVELCLSYHSKTKNVNMK